MFDIDINDLNNKYYLYELPVVFTDQNHLLKNSNVNIKDFN